MKAPSFPQYTRSARSGEVGVQIVSKAVTEDLGWLFRRIPQEHDFGIDGQIQIVDDEDHVTGQLLAIQIKCGPSFFKEQNEWGYVYRGESKHFNYLANYPAPVLIVLCDPALKQCYWAQFTPTAARPTDAGWTLTIPRTNLLAQSKARLLELLGPPANAFAELKKYWELNKLITEAQRIMYVIDPVDVNSGNTRPVREFFDRLVGSQEMAANARGKVDLSFFGYEADPRELYEIAEVKVYASLLDRALPELLFFAATDEFAQGLKTLVLCICDGKIVSKGNAKSGGKLRVEYSPPLLAKFMERHFGSLNQLTDWLHMSEDDNKRITYRAFRHLGMDPSQWDANATAYE